MSKTATIQWGAFGEKHRRYIHNAKDARMAVAEGAIRCIDGDTLIYDPIKRKNIKARHFNGGHVYAFDGNDLVIAEAHGAKRFSRVAMYEVTTKSGKKIVVSAGHRLLTPESWLGISDLLRGASPSRVLVCEFCQRQPLSREYPTASNSGISQKAPRVNALRFWQTAQDFLGRCLTCFRRYDEQPQAGLNIGQGLPPSQACAREHTPTNWRKDETGTVSSGIRSGLLLSHSSKKEKPSRNNAGSFLHLRYRCWLSRIGRMFCGFPFLSYQELHQFPTQPSLAQQALESCQSPLPCSTSEPFAKPPLRGNQLVHNNYTLLYEEVQAIKFVKYDYYYDLHVPNYENYLANGFINHNSGKTIDHCILAAMYLELTPDKYHLATGSTIGNAKLNIGVCNGYGLENLFRGRCKWGKCRDNEALFLYTQTGEKVVVFAGGGKADSYKRILGNSYGLWIATEINEHYDSNDSRTSFIKVAMGRQLAAQRPYTLWDLNPCAPQHPIYDQYIDEYLRNFVGKYVYEHFTIFDNATVSEEQRNAEMAKRKPGSAWYRRDILGERAVAEGLIYSLFADEPKNFIVTRDWLQSHPISTVTIGVDFGGMGSGHAFSCTGFERGYTGLVSLAEWYHNPKKTGRTLDPHQIEAAFVDFARMCVQEYGARIAYCDSAETAMVQGLRNAIVREHIPLVVENARKGAINDRIRFLCRMMAAGRYHVMDGCKHTIEALNTAVWDAKHTTEDVRLDDGTTNIDSLDAEEYSFEPFMEGMTYGGQGRVSR